MPIKTYNANIGFCGIKEKYKSIKKQKHNEHSCPTVKLLLEWSICGGAASVSTLSFHGIYLDTLLEFTFLPWNSTATLALRGRTENFNWNNGFTCSYVSWLTLTLFSKKGAGSLSSWSLLWLVVMFSCQQCLDCFDHKALAQCTGSTLGWFTFFFLERVDPLGRKLFEDVDVDVDVHCWPMCKEISHTFCTEETLLYCVA